MSAVARAKSTASVTREAFAASNQPTDFAPHVYTKNEEVTTLDRRLSGEFVRSIDASNARTKNSKKACCERLDSLEAMPRAEHNTTNTRTTSLDLVRRMHWCRATTSSAGAKAAKTRRRQTEGECK
ncbi:MAG: hypothetical protein U0805_17420 [Pirellulales bacterium]